MTDPEAWILVVSVLTAELDHPMNFAKSGYASEAECMAAIEPARAEVAQPFAEEGIYLGDVFCVTKAEMDARNARVDAARRPPPPPPVPWMFLTFGILPIFLIFGALFVAFTSSANRRAASTNDR